MNRSPLALAVLLGLVAQHVSAAGFSEDSKATLGLRNFYLNADNRNVANQNDQDENRLIVSYTL